MMDEKELSERNAVITEAKTWLKTPYHHMGRIKGAGVDCGMIIVEVFESCKLIDHVEIPYYPFDIACHSDRSDYLDWVKKYTKQVDREPLPRDIIVYKFPGGKVPHHAAIVIDAEYILHSYNRQGVILSNRRSYQRYEIGVFSFWR